MSWPAQLFSVLASWAGDALGWGSTVISTLRPAEKPLHPRGSVSGATLVRRGDGPRSGVPWLDEPGVDVVTVRRSRSAGLPPGWPDVRGLAIRVEPLAGHPADLLFATTGLGRITRFLLTPAWSGHPRPMTTLLPYRSPIGPLLLGIHESASGRFRLLWARGVGPWTQWGDLELHDRQAPDQPVWFDPVRHQLPGLPVYDWVRRLREPAYLAARRHRSDAVPTPSRSISHPEG